jgi:hypothetical protein
MQTILALAPPLTSTLDRIAAAGEFLEVQIGPATVDGWFHGAALARPGSPELATLLARIGQKYATHDRTVMASHVFGEYHWLPMAVSIGCFLTAQRVPDISSDTVALRFNAEECWFDRIRLLTTRFVCLPSDPEADHPDATVVPDLAALRRYLRQQVETHVAQMIETARAQSSLGRRAPWLMAADRFASTIIWLTKEFGDPERCWTEIADLVQAAGSPLRGPSGIMTVEHEGRCEYFLDRATCCLAYKVGDGVKCNTCPLLPIEERQQRLRDYLAAPAH